MPGSGLRRMMTLIFSGWLAVQPSVALEQQETLRIVIVEGDQAIYNVRQRVAREAIIQVEDENRKPVAGALLTLTAPRDGASVVFSNGLNNITLATDEVGRAVVRGIRPNGVEGRFSIRITAVKDGMKGSAEMQVSNAALAPAGGGVSMKLIAVLAAAGAAAAGIAVAARGGDGQKPASGTPYTPPAGQR
jgi:hypothetical protein